MIETTARTMVGTKPLTHDNLTPYEQELVQLMPKLRAYARRLAGDMAHADDLVQEAMLRAIVHADQYQQGTSLGAWLAAILRNRFFDELKSGRKHKVYNKTMASDSSYLITAESQTKRVEVNELAERFAGLTKEKRDVVRFAAEGYTHKEAAARFGGIPEGTVKSRLSRGRRELRQLMKDDIEKGTPSDDTTLRNAHRRLPLLNPQS